MKEDFLHYVWLYKKFPLNGLITAQGEELQIIQTGQHLKTAGPDFFNAQVIVGNQKWAGNIEIHIKSSDWYLHNHEKDIHYDNVVLHVVWENDTPVFRQDNSEIPVLELKKYVLKSVFENYQKLISVKSWINCENQINKVDSFVWQNWQERLFFDRLERKAIFLQELLISNESDWEAVLFCLLAKNFGLNTNGDVFLKVVQSIPFSIIRKESFEIENLEALLFGMANMLPPEVEDTYCKDLKFRCEYLFQKYQLSKRVMEPIQFFRHRPDNFPTIRLAQLAMLYHKQHNLFSKIIETNSKEGFYKLFNISVSEYWQTHYRFDKESSKKEKQFSKTFIDLLVINTVVPLQFAYAKSLGKEIQEEILKLMRCIVSEKNNIIEKFSDIGIMSQNAMISQSLLQLKSEYCNRGKCLQCAIGIQLLKE